MPSAVAITGGTITGVTFTGNITGNASGSAGSVPATGITGCCVAITAGGTGAGDAATARANLGADNATNLTSGTLSWARLPDSGVTAGTYTWGTVTAKGIVTAANNVSTSQISQGDSGVSVGDTGSNGTITFTNDGVVTVVIDPSGNMGIGTATPTQKLDVYGGNIAIRGAAGSNRSLLYTTAASNRWAAYANSTAEGGSNAGSDYVITSYNDAGVALTNVLTLTRSSGAATFAGSVTALGGLVGNLTGNVVGTLTGNVSLPDGVVTSPGLYFTNDTNTGLYRVGADVMGITAGGTDVARFTGGTSNVNYLNISGAAASSHPSIAAAGTDTNINIILTPKGTGGVGIGSTTAAASSLLDLVSTTKGLLPPRMTTTQRDAISGPATGLTIYNTTTNKLNVYNGTAWVAAGANAAGSTGDVQFNTAGDLAADTGNFIWDAINHRLGIGTATPAYPLDVNGKARASSMIVASVASGAGVTGNPASGVAGAIQFSSGTGLTSDAPNFFWDDTNDRLGLGTTTPGSIIGLGGDAARTIGMERGTAAATAGYGLTLQSGGATSGATNKNGGDLVLSSGASTGTGNSKITFKTFAAGGSGTSDNTAATAMTILGSGYVGIGSSTPAVALDVVGAGAFTGTMTASLFSGSGASLSSLNASNLSSGTVGTARLGTGTADSTTYLRGDGTWTSVSGAAPGGSAGGDLSSTYPNPTVAKINGVALGSTTATAGNLLIGSGTEWVSNAVTGDVTITSGGVTAIGSGRVTNAMLAGSIGISKISATGTASSSTFLRGDGAWVNTSTIGGLPGGSDTQIQFNSSGSFGGAAALTYAASGSLLTVTAQAASDKPLIVKGAASQSGDLQEWQNSSASVLAKIDSSGIITIPSIHVTSQAGGTGSYGSPGTAAGNTGDLQYNSAGVFAATTGFVYASSGTNLQITAQNATDKPLIVKGASSQSSNLQEWQTNSGTVLASISSAGVLNVPGTTTLGALTASGAVTLSGLNSAGVVTTNGSGVLATNTTLPAAQFPALTGDATTSAGALATTVAKINGVALGSTTATAGNLLIGSGTQWVTNAVTGDITITSGGVTAIGSGKVTNAMLAGSIAAAKLVGTDIATIGTITSGVWNAGAVTSSGTVTTPMVLLSGTAGGAGSNGSAGAAAGSSGQVQYNSSGAFAGAAGLTYASSGTNVQITAQAATDVPLIVKGAASQSGDLQRWTDSSNTVLHVITSAGNVGIGTTSPDAALSIANVTATGQIGLHLTNSSGSFLLFTDAGSKDYAVGIPDGSQALAFFKDRNPASAGTEVMRLDSSGNVGIGTTSPTGALDVRAADSSTANNVTTSQFSVQELTASHGVFIRTKGAGSNGIGGTTYANQILSYGGNIGLEIYTSDAANLVLGTGATERMRINGSGNVGIGTNNPGYLLDVNGGVHFSGSSASYDTLFNYSTNKDIYLRAGAAAGKIVIGDQNTGTVELTGPGNKIISGNVGIGTASPSALLHVAGVTRVNELIIGETQNTYNGSIEITYNDLSNYGIFFNDTNTGAQNAPALQFYRNGGGVGNVSLTNSSTAYNTSSDRRLKENIADSAAGLGALMQIPVRDFNFIADPGKTRVQGFIAQELYKIYPKAVTVGGDDAKKKPWAVDYGRVTPLIIKAVQELKSLFDGLVAKVEKLYAMVMGHDEQIKKLVAANDNLRADNTGLHRELKAANDNFQHLEQEITALKAVVNRKE